MLLTSVTANVTSKSIPISFGARTIEAIVTGTGTVGATITVYGCNTPRTVNGILLATFTLSGTNSDQAGTPSTAEWPFLYAVLSGISGTGATVDVSVAA